MRDFKRFDKFRVMTSSSLKKSTDICENLLLAPGNNDLRHIKNIHLRSCKHKMLGVIFRPCGRTNV